MIGIGLKKIPGLDDTYQLYREDYKFVSDRYSDEFGNVVIKRYFEDFIIVVELDFIELHPINSRKELKRFIDYELLEYFWGGIIDNIFYDIPRSWTQQGIQIHKLKNKNITCTRCKFEKSIVRRYFLDFCLQCFLNLLFRNRDTIFIEVEILTTFDFDISNKFFDLHGVELIQ